MTTARRFGQALLDGGSRFSPAPESFAPRALPAEHQTLRRYRRVPAWLRAAPRLAGEALLAGVAVAGPFLAYAYHVEMSYVVGLGLLLGGYVGWGLLLRARERRAARQRRAMRAGETR